jgi:hypothetical protein
MPAVSLVAIGTVPYVYSNGTPASANTCQLVTLPNTRGLKLIIHNRDKASKALRISWDSTLTHGGAAPSTFFTVGEPLEITMDNAGESGLQPATQLALFSDSSSVNFEILVVAR